MLVEEHLYFLFVDGAHFVGRDGDFISVFVGALLSDFVDGRDAGAAVVEDAELGEVGGGYFATGVVVEALVALVEVLGGRGGSGEMRGGLLRRRRSSRLS